MGGTGIEFAFVRERPVILNFFASWCGPCQTFSPALEQIANEYFDKFDVYKIDIDRVPEVPALFGVRSVPTTIFFSANEQPALVMGNIGEDGLRRAIADLLNVR